MSELADIWARVWAVAHRSAIAHANLIQHGRIASLMIIAFLQRDERHIGPPFWPVDCNGAKTKGATDPPSGPPITVTNVAAGTISKSPRRANRL
jgi:hypothetical protein